MNVYKIRLTGDDPLTIYKHVNYSEVFKEFAKIKEKYPAGSLEVVHEKDNEIVDLFTNTKKKAQELMTQEQGKKYDLTDDGTGKKYDTGKSMVGTLCNVFPRALLGIGQCIEFGTHKYPKSDNWKKVDKAFTRYQDSLMRHYLKFLAGEVIDSETGLCHLMHVGWNALAILELYLMEHKDYDKELFK